MAELRGDRLLVLALGSIGTEVGRRRSVATTKVRGFGRRR